MPLVRARYSPCMPLFSGLSGRRRKSGEGLGEVVDEVGRVLEAYGEADDAVGDAEAGALLGADAHVGCGRRMGGEGLGVAQVVGDGDEAEGVHGLEGGLLAG